ncbi:MAG: signal peptidase II [Candidatus Omnitrophota bacterium]
MPVKTRKRKQNINGVTFAISICVFVTDFFLKSYLKDNFFLQSIPLIKNILHITVIPNTGAAFGVLQGCSPLLLSIGVIFVAILLFMLKREKNKSAVEMAAFGLILGGAVSNIFDRIVYGFVIDYIDIRVWPVFNIADTCITIGAAILVLRSFKNNAKNLTRV